MKNLATIIIFIIFSLISNENDKLYSNYAEAVNNNSTFQFYLVVKYKNLSTGKVREICSQGNFLHGSIHKEYNLDYSEQNVFEVQERLINNKQRYFEFKNLEAISNLDLEIYSMDDLKRIEQKVDFDKLAQEIKKQKSWSKSLSDKNILLYAHALFNRGILTRQSNCVGGSLVYIKDPKNL